MDANIRRNVNVRLFSFSTLSLRRCRQFDIPTPLNPSTPKHAFGATILEELRGSSTVQFLLLRVAIFLVGGFSEFSVSVGRCLGLGFRVQQVY